jgi:amino acid permease
MRAGENVGWVTMAFVLMSGQIGHGVLCVPSAYREMGYVGATLAILLLSAATTYTGLLLARIRKDRPDIASYQQLFTLAFSSPAVGQCAACCVNLFLFAAICSSVLVQAEAWSGIFPAGCSLRWIAVAAASSTLLLQVRTLSGIGVLSIANCAMLVGLNGVLLGSLFSRASSGSKQAGPRVPFPAEGVAAWVSLLDLLFSFAGHAVFFELMQEMATPDEYA